MLLAAASVLAAAGALAQGQPSLIAVDEIRRGMKGTGLTVFQGTEPEKFDVEVIDVLHNFRPDQDLILVRTKHPILEHANTVAGMSGSPVFLDGRLAGAYAYGWPFGKDPVIGVTPIHKMFEEMRRPVRPDAFPAAEPLEQLASVGSRAARSKQTAHPGRRARPLRHGANAKLEPYRGGPVHALEPLREFAKQYESSLPKASPSEHKLEQAKTPVMLGGFTDGVSSMLDDALEPFGMEALQASGGARDATVQGDLPSYEAGGPIAVQLIRGDITANAIGTITHVGDRRLVAFGHPMMNAGQSGLPTAGARVLHILASQSRSFKIAEATDPRGTLIHDRQSTIVVDQGLQAASVPVDITIHGVEQAPRTQWSVEIANHRALTPVLTFAAMANALQATASDQQDVVFRAETKVEIAGQDPVEVTDRGYVSKGMATASALARMRLFPLMEAAYGNPFEQSRVTSVDVDLHVRFTRDVYRILDAAIATEKVDPGSTVHVRVRVQRLDQPIETRVVPLEIPARAAGEEVEVTLQPGDDTELELPEPESLDDLLDGIQKSYPATSLVASMELPTRGLRFRGHAVRALPGSALDSLQLANTSGIGRPFATKVRQRFDLDNLLTGSAELEIQVRERPRQ